MSISGPATARRSLAFRARPRALTEARSPLYSKTQQLCLLAFALIAAACGGEPESIAPSAPSVDEVAAAPVPQHDVTAAAPALEPATRLAMNDSALPVAAPPAATPPAAEPPATAPPASEPPATAPPAEEPPATPPASEPPPATPPASEPPPATPPASEPPPATPPATEPPPAADPNAGWTFIPRGNMRATFHQGQVGPGTTGLAFTIGIPASRVYRIRYEVLPEGQNFDFRAGGKLPGLGGGSSPSGGSQATDGYSARLMWNQGGRLSFYFYRVTGGVGAIETGGYGTHWMWAADARLIPGQWNTIEIAIDMNTGETIGYLNGVEKARQSLTYLWSTTDKIDVSAFFGGQGAAYAPSKDEAMSFRNMYVKAGN